jgi:hypothetical protein
LQKLQVRPRAGGSGVASWSEPVRTLDWARLPKSCYLTDSSGGHISVLGGDVNSYVGQCAVVEMPDGGSMSGGVVMQAVTVGVDQRLYLGTAKLVGGLPVWTFSLAPGVGNANGIRVKKAAIAGAKDGSSEIVVIGADDDLLYHSVRAANGNWQATGFVPLGGAGGATTFKARDVAIAINASSSTSPGNAQVIASAFDVGAVYHTVRWSTGGWSGFQLVPASGGLNTTSLAITASEYGATYVVAAVTLSNGTVQLVQQSRHADASWNPSFTTVAVQPGVALSASNSVALTSTPDGGVQLLYADAKGGAWLQLRLNPDNSWSQPTLNTELATSSVRSVSISAPSSGSAPSQILLTRTSPY